MIGALFVIVLLGVAYIEAYCFRALIKTLIYLKGEKNNERAGEKKFI